MTDFFEELWDEVSDFFEDFWDHLSEKPEKAIKTKTALIGGAEVAVRPAYLFAERVDNLLKVIFGLSIAVSAFTASFLGFASLSELIDALVSSFWGRGAMFIIGISYLIIALWKLMHIGSKKEVI